MSNSFATSWTLACQATLSVRFWFFQARILDWVAISFSEVMDMFITLNVVMVSCWGPLTDWNLVVQSRPIRKQRREKESLIFLGLRRKPIKSLTQGLLCSWRPQAPSQWGEGPECLLERVLEARARKWNQKASALQRISLRERERKKARHGDQSSDGTKVF